MLCLFNFVLSPPMYCCCNCICNCIVLYLSISKQNVYYVFFSKLNNEYRVNKNSKYRPI